MPCHYLFAAATGYLLGSIPFGLILTRMAGTEDILKIGSKSIGTTNVLRTGRKDLAALTLLLDLLKAGFAAWLAAWLLGAEAYGLAAGAAAVVGHCFPVWLGFRGGKGVASAFGFILFTAPEVAGLAAATWLIVAVLTRYSSLSAITAAALVPVYTWFWSDSLHFWFYLPLVALVEVRHHANIARLLKGQESKIKFSKKK